jgi:hypothetical protein
VTTTTDREQQPLYSLADLKAAYVLGYDAADNGTDPAVDPDDPAWEVTGQAFAGCRVEDVIVAGQVL